MREAIQPIFAEDKAKNTLLKVLGKAKKFDLAYALITSSGVEIILAVLKDRLESGAKGRILFGVDMASEPKAIQMLLKLQKAFPQRLSLRFLRSPRGRIFHSKIAIVESAAKQWAVLLGSSNLSSAGLRTNYEANVLIQHGATAHTFRKYFEELFHGAYSAVVDRVWLDSYECVWRESKGLRRQESHLQQLVRKLQPTPEDGRKMPRKIRGHVWCFTGGIPDWPRDRMLYPKVRQLGGRVVELPGIKDVHYLVHGSSLGTQDATRKLVAARNAKIPIITEEAFLKVLDRSRTRKGV